MISILVATDPNGVIGKGNTIPWYISEDLKLFKRRTLDSSIIMGRATWDSLPKKPLLGRINYILSRGEGRATPHCCLAESLAGPIWCKSLDCAIEDASKNTTDEGEQKEIYIIGGEQIYKLALESGIVDQIILSRVHKSYEGDKYFHLPEGWKEVSKETHSEFDVLHFVKQ